MPSCCYYSIRNKCLCVKQWGWQRHEKSQRTHTGMPSFATASWHWSGPARTKNCWPSLAYIRQQLFRLALVLTNTKGAIISGKSVPHRKTFPDFQIFKQIPKTIGHVTRHREQYFLESGVYRVKSILVTFVTNDIGAILVLPVFCLPWQTPTCYPKNWLG